MQKILLAGHTLKPGKSTFICTYKTLSSFLFKQGFVPFISAVPPKKNNYQEIARAFLHDWGGLILHGGKDLDETPNRTRFELALIREAIAKNIPVFGICRGMQIINKYFDGDLYDDISEISRESSRLHDPVQGDPNKYKTFTVNLCELPFMHEIKIINGGILSVKFSEQEKVFKVNSAHHQAVKNLGQGLFVEAKSGDGVVEAVSDIDKKILGVQWHPEQDTENPDYKKVFEVFLEWVRGG